MSVLDRPRMVIIGGEAERFRDFAHLEERAGVLTEIIQRAAARASSNEASAVREWQFIEHHALLLRDVMIAQEAWLAEHDIEITTEISKTQDLIYDLANLRPS